MELNDLKDLWQQHDNAMQHNKQVSEQLITKMLQKDAKSGLKKLLNIEYASAIVGGLVLMAILLMMTHIPDGKLMACYIVFALCTVGNVLSSIYKIRSLDSIDMSLPVADTFKKMEEFRMYVNREKLALLVVLPLMIITGVILGKYWVLREFVFDNISGYLPHFVAGTIAGIILLVVLYGRFYFQNIKEIKGHLNDINALKQA